MRITALSLFIGLAALSPAIADDHPPPPAATIAASSFTVPGGGEGIRLHVLRRQPERFGRAIPVLMLHPYGAPCAEAFDLPGMSWMQDLSQAGFDVFALDFRGFGLSSKPQSTAPVGRATDAVGDVVAAIEAIRRITNAPKVAVVAWSWGSVVAPMVAAERPDLIEKLVLFGSMQDFSLPMMTQPFAAKDDPSRFGPSTVAYQRLETTKVLGHWRMMLGDRHDLADDATIAQVEALAERCSVGHPQYAQGFTIRPMGPLQDLFEIWTRRPIYDPARVIAPTLVIRGDRDVFADPALAGKLPKGRELVIDDATHWLPFERNRDTLFDATRRFLEEK